MANGDFQQPKDSSPGLIDFWQQWNIDEPPFAHPQDLPILKDSSRWVEDDAADFDTYITGPRFANPDDNKLHLSLLPVPYAGNLRKAKIVILFLNPSFSYSDYWAESHGPGFRERVVENLHQSFVGNEFPFLFLDPKFCWNGGFIWWEKKLRKTIQKIAAHKFKNDYRKALKSLSCRLACVELFPYHSASFKEHRLLGKLASVKAARQFVSDELIPKAKAGKRTVIVTRQATAWDENTWDVKKRDRSIVIYKGGHTRGASLGPNSKGGKAILQRYGISE